MKELAQEEQNRIAELVRIAYERVITPAGRGPRWTRYETDQADTVRNALWQSHLILTGSYLKTTEEPKR